MAFKPYILSDKKNTEPLNIGSSLNKTRIKSKNVPQTQVLGVTQNGGIIIPTNSPTPQILPLTPTPAPTYSSPSPTPSLTPIPTPTTILLTPTPGPTIENQLPPPQIEEINIEKVNNGLKLSWTPGANSTGYNIYRDTTAYFSINPSLKIATVSNAEYTDETPNITGDPQTNHFYTVTNVNNFGESEPITYVGEFDYNFERGKSVRVAIPFTTLPFQDTQSAKDYIGMISGQILKYDNEKHFFFVFEIDNPFSFDFAIVPLNPYYILVNNPNTKIVTFTGTFPKNPPTLTFHDKKNFLAVLPLYKNFNTAQDIGNAFLPYIKKVFLDNTASQYIEYKEGNWQGENVPIQKGYAYFIELSQAISWQYGSPPVALNE